MLQRRQMFRWEVTSKYSTTSGRWCSSRNYFKNILCSLPFDTKKNIYLVNENPTIIIIRCLRQHVDSKEGYPCVFTVSWTLGLPIIPGLDNSKKFIQSFHLYRHDTCSACRCDYGRECRGNTIWLCRYACLCFEADLGLSWRWWW